MALACFSSAAGRSMRSRRASPRSRSQMGRSFVGARAVEMVLVWGGTGAGFGGLGSATSSDPSGL